MRIDKQMFRSKKSTKNRQIYLKLAQSEEEKELRHLIYQHRQKPDAFTKMRKKKGVELALKEPTQLDVLLKRNKFMTYSSLSPWESH